MEDLRELIRLSNYVIISAAAFVILIRLVIFGAMRALDLFKAVIDK